MVATRHTIGIRGIVAISLVAIMACTSGLGILSFVQLRVVDATAAALRRNMLPAVEAAEQLSRAAEQAHSSQAMLLLDLPETDRRHIAGDIALQAQIVTSEIEALTPPIAVHEWRPSVGGHPGGLATIR